MHVLLFLILFGATPHQPTDADCDGFPGAAELRTSADRRNFRRWFANIALSRRLNHRDEEKEDVRLLAGSEDVFVFSFSLYAIAIVLALLIEGTALKANEMFLVLRRYNESFSTHTKYAPPSPSGQIEIGSPSLGTGQVGKTCTGLGFMGLGHCKSPSASIL